MDVVVLIGLPGAGKSTFYRQRFAGSHAHVSRDHFPNSRNPARRQRELIGAALARGQPVVVDNTSPDLAARALIVEAARAHGASRVVGYFFPPDVERALRQNAGREGRARVPDVAIYASRKRLVAPSLAEGFDALYLVEPGEDRFEVRPLAA